MAIATPVNLGTNTLASTAQTVVITTVADAAIGDTVFVAFYAAGSGAATVTDSAGNTYASMNGRMAGSTLTANLPAGSTITVTTTQTAALMNAAAVKTSGLVSPLAVHANSTPTSGTSLTPTAGAVTTTVADTLIIGVIAMATPSPGTVTPTNSFTLLTGPADPASGSVIKWEYRIVSATGAYTPALSLSASKAYDGRASSFAMATVLASAGSSVPLLLS
jgi:hypothetical protein